MLEIVLVQSMYLGPLIFHGTTIYNLSLFTEILFLMHHLMMA